MGYCTRCDECSGKESWRKYCRSCYRIEMRKVGNQRQREMHYLRSKNARLAAQLGNLRSRHQTATSIDAAMLRKLLTLCQPDKHDNFKLANTVTKWLLAQRDAT